MKTALTMKALVGLILLVGLGSLRAHAQAEIDPDHYDTPSAKTLQREAGAGKSNLSPIRYEGKVVLPYSVRCRGKSLAPGGYSISLDSSDGRKAQLTLNRKGQRLSLEVIPREHKENSAPNALIVERVGKTHRLSMVHVARLDFLLDTDPPSAGRDSSVEQVAFTLLGSKK